MMGTWMQQTAQGFLVYELTKSPAYLGYVGFAAGLPVWMFTLYGGLVAGQVPKRKLMQVTQTVMMVLAFILAGLVFSGLIQAWHIIVLAFLLGIANAFDTPARMSIVSEMVDREDLNNAVALNGTLFNAGSAIGPAAAGLAYALVGPGWCFMINGVSFIGVIIALRKMDMPGYIAKPIGSIRSQLAEGIRYIAGHKTILTMMLLASVTSLFGVSITTLFPAWAVNILGGDSTTNGLLQSARGMGALSSVLFIASLGRFDFRGKLLTIGSFVFPLTMLLFSFATSLPIAMILLYIGGLANILIMNLSNSLVQSLAPDTLRGRVMAIYSLNFFGLAPLGALWVGSLAEYTNEPLAAIIGAVISLCVASGLWLFAPWVRKLT